MGLNMYFIKKRYVGGQYEHRKITGNIDIKKDGKEIPLNLNKISYIEEDAGYWRKANAIHKWFVDNVQDGNDDCREYWVSREKMKELLDLCKKVKEIAILKEGKIQNGESLKNGKWVPIMVDGKYIENEEEVAELLPTQDGFFFGGTQYDEWYLQDVDNTIEILENALKESENDYEVDFYYQSSW